MRIGHLPKGTYRLTCDIDVEKGQWYIGFVCPDCKSRIYALKSPSGNVIPPIVGEGKFGVSCKTCRNDSIIIENSELMAFQADVDIPSSTPKRRKPSNKPRQPLWNTYPKAHATFGPAMLEKRPDCAAIIGRCIIIWNYNETELALLLASLLKIAYTPAAAIYTVIQNSRMQQNVLRAAAQTILSAPDMELLDAVLNLVATFEKERNDLVHGIIGGSMIVDQGIIWTSQKDYLDRMISGIKGTFDPNDTVGMKKLSFVYEPEDLESIAQRFEWLHGFIGSIRGYYSSGNHEWRAERYPQLCAEPLLAQELSRMRADQKKTPELRPSQNRKDRRRGRK